MKKKIILAAAVIVIVAAVAAGYVNINRKLPASAKRTAALGKELEFQQGVFISVDNKKFLSQKERDQIYKNAGEQSLMDSKFMDVTITLENKTRESKKFSVTDLNLECVGSAFAIPMMAAEDQDRNYGPLQVTLKPGESKQLVYPFEIMSNHFTKRQWKNIESRKFWLTYSAYPKKTILYLE